MSIADTRAALSAAARDARPKLNAYPYPDDNPQSPAFVVGGFTANTATFGGVNSRTWACYVLVDRNNTDQIALLDVLVDPDEATSVVTALQARTDVMEVRVEGTGFMEWAGQMRFAATLAVEVVA